MHLFESEAFMKRIFAQRHGTISGNAAAIGLYQVCNTASMWRERKAKEGNGVFMWRL